MSANTDLVLAWMGGLSGTVGWDANALQSAVNEAVVLINATDEITAQSMTGWKQVLYYASAKRILREASMDFNYSADGESFSRSNVPAQIAKYLVAETYLNAAPYVNEGTSEISSVDLGWSPYRRDP